MATWIHTSTDPSPCIDADGNEYSIVTIGGQEWMSENLKTTKYNDGTSIPRVTVDDDWKDLTTGARSEFDNDTNKSGYFDSTKYSDTYGYFYNWYAVETGNLAPDGWHVPTDDECTALTDYLGGTSVAGGKMKEVGTDHWSSPNTGATDESGFTGLPGGSRNGYHGGFGNLIYQGFFWSSTEYSSDNAWYRKMRYDDSEVSRGNLEKDYGFSVRCVRDESQLNRWSSVYPLLRWHTWGNETTDNWSNCG